MANAKGHLKLTGDTHLPDVESDLALEEGTASLAPLARGRTLPGRPNVVRRAGTLRERDESMDEGADVAGAPQSTGEDAMPAADAARPSARSSGGTAALAAAARPRAGNVVLGIAGAWLLLKLLRR